MDSERVRDVALVVSIVGLVVSLGCSDRHSTTQPVMREPTFDNQGVENDREVYGSVYESGVRTTQTARRRQQAERDSPTAIRQRPDATHFVA
jgi:hypothetical protein